MWFVWLIAIFCVGIIARGEWDEGVGSSAAGVDSGVEGSDADLLREAGAWEGDDVGC